jgi:hypothetical protein
MGAVEDIGKCERCVVAHSDWTCWYAFLVSVGILVLLLYGCASGQGVSGVGPRGVKGAEGVAVWGQSESEPRRSGQDWTARALLFGRVTCIPR